MERPLASAAGVGMAASAECVGDYASSPRRRGAY